MRLRLQDHLTPFALSAHLLCHDFLNFLRRLNIFDLDSCDLHAPRVRSLIQRCLHPCVDRLAACQRLVEFHVADDIAERRRGKILKACDRIFHTIGIKLRIKDPHEHNRIDLHRDVIFCDNRLRRKIKDLFLKRDYPGNSLDERNLHMDACIPNCFEFSEMFDDRDRTLRDDPHIGKENNQDNNGKNHNQNNAYWTHTCAPLNFYRIR